MINSKVLLWVWFIATDGSESMQTFLFPQQGSLPPALPNRFTGHKCQLYCIHLMQSSPHPIGPKGCERASESRTQRHCPVLNAMVPVVSSQAQHLRFCEILPPWSSGDRRPSITTFLLGPLDKANVATELRMTWEERSEGTAKEEE